MGVMLNGNVIAGQNIFLGLRRKHFGSEDEDELSRVH